MNEESSMWASVQMGQERETRHEHDIPWLLASLLI
jgi:hypothetical protein